MTSAAREGLANLIVVVVRATEATSAQGKPMKRAAVRWVMGLLNLGKSDDAVNAAAEMVHDALLLGNLVHYDPTDDGYWAIGSRGTGDSN